MTLPTVSTRVPLTEWYWPEYWLGSLVEEMTDTAVSVVEGKVKEGDVRVVGVRVRVAGHDDSRK